MTSSPWFHTHTHSEFSAKDALSHVADRVVDGHTEMGLASAAADMGQQGLGLTDHGVMTGVPALYTACRKVGLLPFPGLEAYISPDPSKKLKSGLEKRYHLTLMARTLPGYEALVKLSSLSHTRDRYHFKPRLALSDLGTLSQAERDGLVVGSGCFFGLVAQSIVTGDDRTARAALEQLAGVIPRTHVEIQHHNIDHGENWTDDLLASALWSLAQEMGLPVLVTQDSHYCEPQHRAAHSMMKRLFIHSTTGEDAAFPGDSYHLASAAWVRRHYDDQWLRPVWEAGEASCQTLLDEHALTIPALEQYRYYVPSMTDRPLARLKLRCRAKAKALGLTSRVYRDRLDRELDIIWSCGFAGYFDLVTRITDFCRAEGILYEIRGSGNGCLVAYLLGITHIDPVKWGLIIERFIDKARTKPPDFDIDIEDVFRDRVVEWLHESGLEAVQIGTMTRMSIADDQEGGSLLVSYLGLQRRAMDEEEFDEAFKYGPGSLTEKIAHHSVRDLKRLRQLDKHAPRRDPSSHAAGFVVTDQGYPVGKLVPTMLVPSSGRTVTQYLMDDVEDMGFIKIDLLGQRTLTVIRRTQELMGREDPCDLSWIPDRDREACKVLSEGVPDNGIFQFEGYAMARGVRDYKWKLKGLNDAIAAVALFRPATMESGNTDRYFRHRPTKGADVDYPSPVFAKHLTPTFGAALYQEQCLEALRDLGMASDHLNQFLKAVKVKHGHLGHADESTRIFNENKAEYERLAKASGMNASQVAEGWSLIEGFAGYGFNKAHSTGYGHRAYFMAYLKAHHPLEYMTACLETTAGTPKEAKYVREARRQGIRILPPDVNLSGPTWTMDRTKGGIRKGLVTVKRVGMGAAEEIARYAPYSSVDDLCTRTDGRKVTGQKLWASDREFNGVLDALHEAGALDSIMED